MLCECEVPEEDRTSLSGLNPCSNGRCSARASEIDLHKEVKIVLILVLMEDALRGWGSGYLY